VWRLQDAFFEPDGFSDDQQVAIDFIPVQRVLVRPVSVVRDFARRGSQVVRPRSAKPLFTGSIPVPAFKCFSQSDLRILNSL
jgi:hypothetical protein